MFDFWRKYHERSLLLKQPSKKLKSRAVWQSQYALHGFVGDEIIRRLHGLELELAADQLANEQPRSLEVPRWFRLHQRIIETNELLRPTVQQVATHSPVEPRPGVLCVGLSVKLNGVTPRWMSA